MKTIFNLAFSKNLKQLKTYLRKTSFLRQYVPFYTQKTLPLQKRKTKLLKNASQKNKQRQRHNKQTSINDFSKAEIDFFNQLQSSFNRSIFLIHFDRIKILYIDIDASKKRDFDIIIYHVKRKKSINEKPEIFSISPK